MDTYLYGADADPAGINDRWELWSSNGRWHWTRFAQNNRVVGASSQSYGDRRACLRNAWRNGYRTEAVEFAEILYGDPFGLADDWDIYPSGGLLSQHWRWRRTAPNGEIVGASSEGYYHRDDCVRNARRHGYPGQ